MDVLEKNTLIAILLRSPLNLLAKYCTLNTQFRDICNSDEFWRLRYENDFNEQAPNYYPAKSSYFSYVRWKEFQKEKQRLFEFMLSRIPQSDQSKFKEEFPEWVDDLYDETFYPDEHYYDIVVNFLEKTNITSNGARADGFNYVNPRQQLAEQKKFISEVKTIGNFMLDSIKRVDENPQIIGGLN